MAPVPKNLGVPRLPPGGSLSTGRRGTVPRNSFVLKLSGAVPGIFCCDFYHDSCVVVTNTATEERRTHSPKKNRGINWTDEATEALLELWAEESIQMSLEHSKSSKETRAVYENLKVSYVIVVWEITLILKTCNPLKNIADRSTFQCIVHGDIFVNLRCCVLGYVI